MSSENFSRRLRASREQLGLSQGALAKRAGLQPSAVSHFETGLRKPSFDNLRRLADALRVTTDHLLGRDGADESDLARTEALYRHYSGLSAESQEIVNDLVRVLASKAGESKPTGK